MKGNNSMRKTKLEMDIERSLKRLSLDEKMRVYINGSIYEKFCNTITLEMMSQEAILNLNPIRWRGIKAGLNVPFGTIIHIDSVLVSELGKELGAQMISEQLFALLGGNMELLREVNKCLSKKLK